MAAQEHLVLSSLIKSVHQDLRIRSRVLGSKTAWVEHCNKKEKLKEYAAAMHKLATQYWENNTGDDTNSRIEWVVKQCQSYFIDGGVETCNAKEQLKISRIKSFNERGDEFVSSVEFTRPVRFNKPLLMLDVGSCYNPFKKYSLFTTLPVDLAPATEDVYPCDFLEVKVSKNEIANHRKMKTITELLSSMKCGSNQMELPQICSLPSEVFDVINFSLFLEYLPSADQRYACCLKAFDLLKSRGLLFIITPDSKHQTANAPIMRNWRIALETMGFIRVAYQKLTHLHCMAYRKCPHPVLPKILSEKELSQSERYAKSTPSDMMVIPQDFYVNCDKLEKTDSISQENLNSEDVNYFPELPMSF